LPPNALSIAAGWRLLPASNDRWSKAASSARRGAAHEVFDRRAAALRPSASRAFDKSRDDALLTSRAGERSAAPRVDGRVGSL
jgi:hypothetical protein